MVTNIELSDALKTMSIQEVCKKYDLSFYELFSKISNIPRNHYKPRKRELPTYIYPSQNKFFIQKTIESKDVMFGSYFDFHEAVKVRNELIRKGWNVDPDNYLGDKYITINHNRYVIAKKVNGEHTTFGRYASLKVARQVRDCLVRFDWDKDYLPLIQRQLGVYFNG